MMRTTLRSCTNEVNTLIHDCAHVRKREDEMRHGVMNGAIDRSTDYVNTT
jgi:hypothetical protein